MPRSVLFGLVCLAFCVASCRQEAVVRVFDGHATSGRWISPEAYAAFAAAAIDEENGRREAAIAGYERAIAEDSGNAIAWSRLGLLRCTSERARADQAFARAETLGPTQETPWLARAQCDLARNDPRSAAAHALRAAALAPTDGEASRLVATTLERSGDAVGARRWRRGLSLDAESTRARESGRDRAGERTLDRALDRADGSEIERFATRERVGSAELSLRAVARGRIDVSIAIATRVLEADPSSSDARIAALVSADLGGDEPALARFAAGARQGSPLPGALGAALMRDLISRRIGPEAADLWISAYRAAAARGEH